MDPLHPSYKWLTETPNYSTFRINKLLNFNFNSNKLENFLIEQSKELNLSEIPKFYLLKPDCLVLEKWPTNITADQGDKEVIVDAACAASVLRGSHVYAPGVLAMPPGCKLNEIVAVHGDLDGKCKRGLKVAYSGNTQYVGMGYLKMLRCHLFDKGVQPSGIAIHIIFPVSRLPVVNETLYSEGEVLLQNLPSIVVGWVVDAKPKEFILDMCAAPGNKTTHLAEMSNDKAIILALDRSNARIGMLKRNCEKHKITCVKAFTFDSTKCYSEEVNRSVLTGPPFMLNCFDKVLLDAPCSGLGQRPQLINKMNPKTLDSYKFLQRKLVTAAVNVLKVGGKLIYSTCTVTIDENEGLIAWALETFPCLKLIPAKPLLGGPGLSDVGLSNEQRIMVQRFGPEEDDLRPVDEIYKNTIGFFIATFTKIS